MNWISEFNKRSSEDEIMDDLHMKGEILETSLDEIAWINRYLGGNRITWKGVKKILKRDAPGRISITDLGCGGGDGLRYLANKFAHISSAPTFTGIDANGFTLEYARNLSKEYPQITFIQGNILNTDLSFQGTDLVILALFLHHFSQKEIYSLIQKCKRSGVKYLLINDLQRHPIPYVLFFLLSKLLKFGSMAHHDGLLSIRRGFTRRELIEIARENNISTYHISWKWAFRYLAIFHLQ